MKLKKLIEEHYIIVDESDIKDGEYCLSMLNEVVVFGKNFNQSLYRKITHSTEPIEGGTTFFQNRGDKLCYDKIGVLSLSEVKELLGEVDVDRKAVKFSKRYSNHDDSQEAVYDGYNEGYKQCLIDNKEKMFTEEDVRNAISFGNNIQYTRLTLSSVEKEMRKFIQFLQSPTEWEVEFVDDKLKHIQ